MITVIGAAAIGLWHLLQALPSTWLHVVALVAVFAAAVCIWQLARYRFTLTRLHARILDAQEGLLEPASTNDLHDKFLRRLVGDYDVMVTRLRSMFSTVEECQARVLDERNKINAVLNSLPGALLNVADDLRITGVNKTAEELFQTTAEQLVGANLFDLLRPEERDRELLRDAFLYKRPARNREICLPLHGRHYWLSLNMAFVSEREADMGVVITLQDVTEFRQLQDSVTTREKLVAMGQLAAGVAHELNTPLGNILGYSQLIRDEVNGSEKLERYTNIVSDEARRCSRIVQDLLNYARRDRCDGESCDLNALVHEVTDTFVYCRMKRYNIDIELQLVPGGLIVEGGCGQLDIVLTNLVLNAIQALHEVDNPRIRIRTFAADNGIAALCVEDNGPGIAPEHRGRIFDPFFTTKQVGEGSGLGLPISQAMIVRRGGDLSLDAAFTDGARFVLRLPAVTAKQECA